MPGTRTITQDQVEAILDALADLDVGVRDDAVKPAYSGRAMYGATCFGIVLEDDSDALLLGMAIHKALEDDEDIARRLGKAVRTDNLSSDTIFYFPGWTIESEEPEEQDETALGG